MPNPPEAKAGTEISLSETQNAGMLKGLGLSDLLKKPGLSPWTTEVVMKETQDPPPLWAIELENGELRFFKTEEEAKAAQEEGEER